MGPDGYDSHDGSREHARDTSYGTSWPVIGCLRGPSLPKMAAFL